MQNTVTILPQRPMELRQALDFYSGRLPMRFSTDALAHTVLRLRSTAFFMANASIEESAGCLSLGIESAIGCGAQQEDILNLAQVVERGVSISGESIQFANELFMANVAQDDVDADAKRLKKNVLPKLAKAFADDFSDIRAAVKQCLSSADFGAACAKLHDQLSKLARVDSPKSAKFLANVLSAQYAQGLEEAAKDLKHPQVANESFANATDFDDVMPWSEALKVLRDKDLMPTDMTSEELEEVDAAIKERSFFSARVFRAEQLQKLQNLVEKQMQGDLGDTDARMQMKLFNQSIGYEAPEGKTGTISDLSSSPRLNLVLRTNSQLVKGRARWDAETSEAALAFYPCQELSRKFSRLHPRKSSDGVEDGYWQEQWEELGGTLVDDDRMVALKTDEICSNISYFGVPYGPPSFNSGYRWTPISRDEAIELGVIDEDLDPDEEFGDMEDEDFNEDLQMTIEGIGDLISAAMRFFGYTVGAGGVVTP